MFKVNNKETRKTAGNLMFHSSDNVEISFPFGVLLKAVIQGEKYLSNITLKGRTGHLASYIHLTRDINPYKHKSISQLCHAPRAPFCRAHTIGCFQTPQSTINTLP